MPELTAQERRVCDVALRLAEVEKKLSHALAILPGLVREVREINETIEEALASAPVKAKEEPEE